MKTIFKQGKKDLVSHVEHQFFETSCTSPTINEVEQILAGATIFIAVGSENKSHGQPGFKWKRRAHAANFQPETTPTLEKIGKRK